MTTDKTEREHRPSTELSDERAHCERVAQALLAEVTDLVLYGELEDSRIARERVVSAFMRERQAARAEGYQEGRNAGYMEKAREADALTTGMLEIARCEGRHEKHAELRELQSKHEALSAAARECAASCIDGPARARVFELVGLLPQTEHQQPREVCEHKHFPSDKRTYDQGLVVHCYECGNGFDKNGTTYGAGQLNARDPEQGGGGR